MDERDEEEKRRKEEQQNKKIQIQYNIENEEAKQKAFTSFGRLILGDEKSEPIWSLGNEKKFAQTGYMVTMPKDTPGPKYPPVNEEIYKYKYEPKWKIGKDKKRSLTVGEEYEYFKHPYEPECDFSAAPKKWNRKVGGAIGLEARMFPDILEKTPGPGRYEPNLTQTKPRTLAYIMGEKTNYNDSLRLLTGTNEIVGPGKYRVEQAKYTSIHKTLPQWRFGNERRKGLFNKYWTKNETYEIYSSVHDQIRTHKRSEPHINIGKSTRDGEKKRGVFPSTMENAPTKVRLELPKF